MSNNVTRQYIEDCRAPGSRLADTARDLVLPDIYSKSYGDLLLDRPVFVAEREISAFADDMAAVFAILVSLPDRLFGGDLRQYCAALGMDPRMAELMCLGATGRPPLQGRADAYHDGTSFKMLELNVGTELGGTDAAQLNRAYLRVPEFNEFARRHGLRHTDTAGRIADALRAAGEPMAGGEPVVALIESTGGIAAHEHVFLALREAMADHGIDLLLGELHEVGERNGKITLRGAPLDVVLRFFVAGELVDDPAGQQALDLIVKAHDAGTTALYTPLEAAVFASKGSLAMLHDPGVRTTLSAAERTTVDRIVPWTRLLGAGHQHDGDLAELIERCRGDRADLVLKPGVGYSGVGTVVGHEVSDEQWSQALEAGLAGDHVVQRLVRAAAEPVLNADTGVMEHWVANWGVFVDADGYAGAFVRALKAADGAIVSYTNSGTRGTCVFTDRT